MHLVMKLLKHGNEERLIEFIKIQCMCIVPYDENREGPFYTQLGTAQSVAKIRVMMELR
jgi:hypothetical protein